MNPRLRVALCYLGRGWSVVPLCPPDHAGVGEFHRATCEHPGKRPLCPWKALQARRLTAEEVTAAWEAVPKANVGVVLGRVSGLVGIDLDGDGAGGLLKEISGGDLPQTLAFRTARGSRLLYSTGREQVVPTRAWRRDGVEVKVLGEGSLTVMPPSVHASGRRYAWRGSGRRAPARAPSWFLRVTRQPSDTPAVISGVAAAPAVRGEGVIPEGARNLSLFKLGCRLRRAGEGPASILAALTAVNLSRCRPPLSAAEVAGIARSASQYPAECGPK